MKLLDVILFVSAICIFAIAIHQSITYGIAESYWLYMLSLSALFIYGYRKNQRPK